MASDEEKDKKRFLKDIINRVPGGSAFNEAVGEVTDAYQEGGLPSAIGMSIRKSPGVAVSAVQDIYAPEPVRKGLKNLVGGSMEAGRVALTGEVTPQSNLTPRTNLTQLPSEPMMSTERPLAQPTLSQLANPVINEVSNERRNAELGKMTSSAERLDSGGQRNTFSIGGNTLSYDLSDKDLAIKKSIEAIDNRIAQGITPTEEQAKRIASLKSLAGYTRGGTDRVPESGNNRGLRDLASQEAENRFNSRPPVNPTEAQLKQWDYNQGLKSGRSMPPTDPYAGLGPKTIRELMVQESRNKQSGRDTAATSAVAAERNRILEEQNIAQERRLSRPEQMKSDTKVIKVPDGIGGTKEEIWARNSEGQYVPAMGNQQRTKPMPKSKDSLIPGESYTLPDGRIGIWNGEDFTL